MAKEGEAKKKERIPQANKRDHQNAKKKFANRTFKSEVRTAIRSFEEAVTTKDNSKINSALSIVYSLMDKGVKRGIFKINKAGRTKSRLAAKAAK
jgi:small subunit ribosomal protein S20